jgi:hypothetical protein
MGEIIRTKQGYEVKISPKMKLNGYFLTELDAEKALASHEAAYTIGKEIQRKNRHGKD